MRTNRRWCVGLALLIAPACFGVEGLTITVQSTNVVLSWPSTGTENYLIQYRASLDTNNPWTNLTNNYPAAQGTNTTSYTVYGVVPPPTSGESGGGGGGAPPPPSAPMSASADRELMPWEVEDRPPYPSEAKAYNAWRATYFPTLESFQTTGMSSLESVESVPATGFYRVFHVPTFSQALSGATVDGYTFVPVDYADYVDRIVQSEVVLNGQPFEFAEQNTRTFGGVPYDGIDFWFDQTTNGSRGFSIRTTIRLDDEVNEFMPTLTLTSKVVTATIDNPVLFTNWDPVIVGTSTVFEAFSLTPDVNWTFDVYDVVGDFVVSQSGYSADGHISWTWDLIDGLGTLRDDWLYDPVFYPELTITPSGGAQAAAAPRPAPVKALDYPAEGTWVIFHQDRVKPPARSDYIQAMNAIAGGPALYDLLAGTLLLKYGTDYTQAERNASWADLRGLFSQTSSRNYYYEGHGSGDAIGGDVDAVDANGTVTGAKILANSTAYITSDWMKKNITFNKYTGARYMRFIFLDGCQTSKSGWPGAFGVPKATNALSYYTAAGRKPNTRPSAFVGWEKIVGGSPQWGTTASYKFFRTQWMSLWSFDAQYAELDSAFQQARNTSGWITQQLMDSALRIYGYNKLGFREYNRRVEWQGP